ncbi:MAG: hypothetical protein JXB04_09570 [Kiritimatiellae bacterium]|nr:hypothetical protein [Kiritimatiellia bacterium]
MSGKTSRRQDVLYVIPHSHFDLVWRRPPAWYRRRRARIYRAVLDLLEARPALRYTFCQVLPLREYLADHRAEASRVRRLLEEGRLEITGAPMSIPDLNLSSGEAIVRNQMTGRRWLKKRFGVTPRSACFEDAFGLPASLPQILLRCGAEVFRSSRMPRPGRGDLTGTFLWQGLDGQVLPCAGQSGLSWGFGESPNVDDPPHNYRQRVEQYRRDLEGPARAHTRRPRFFLLVGEEHVPTARSFDAFEEAAAQLDLRFRWATFDEFLADAASVPRSGAKGKPVRDDFSRLFTGCYSTRPRQKQLIFELEANLLGAGNALACYGPSGGVLDAAWDDLFLTQFHDALDGCHTRDNALYVESTARHARRRVRDAVAGKAVVNTLAYERWIPFLWPRGAGGKWQEAAVQPLDDDLVCAERMPAMSRLSAEPQIVPADRLPSAQWITACGGKVALEFQGERGVLHSGGASWEAPGLLRLREDRGTLWTEKYTGREWIEEPGQAALEGIEIGEVFSRAVWRGQYHGRTPWPGFEALSWRRSVVLFREQPCVWLRIELDWKGCGTEVSWSLRSAAGRRVPTLYGSVPFGFVQRSTYKPTENGFQGDVFPSPQWAGAMFGRSGWLVLHRGHPAFRGVAGGIENVLLRSPVAREMPFFPVEPDATAWANGRHKADFLLVPTDRFDGAEAARLGMAFAADPLAALPAAAPGRLAKVLASVPAGLVVTSFTKEPSGWGLRLYEARGRAAAWHLPRGLAGKKKDFTGAALGARSTRLQFRPFEACDVAVSWKKR